VQEIAGVATFSGVTLNTIGGCQLLATDTTAPDTTFTPLNAAITVTAGAPTKLVFTTPPPATDLTIGSALTPFAVSVEDVNGHVETSGTGSTDSIVVTATGCTLGGTTSALAVAGVATFSGVTVTSAGTCAITATDVTRTVTAATATTFVGEAQAALAVSTKTGYLDAPLTLATTGGSGTGSVTYTVTNGTATVCTITNGTLTAKTAGTCLVTATKAAVSPYASITSAATTVTISSAPKALRVVGSIINGRKTTVTVTGYNFAGRPRIISNVAGFKATVSRDSGKSLTIVVTVTGKSKPGVKVMTIILASGTRTSVKYSLRG
jgi:trimeric autotransporter adhesin